MTPKEKAKELVDRFSDIDDMGRFSDVNGYSSWSTIVLKKQVKQCALIAVDEIIDYSSEWDDSDYWEEVKQEIEKL